MRLLIVGMIALGLLGCGTERGPELRIRPDVEMTCTQEDLEGNACVCVAEIDPEKPLALPKIVCAPGVVEE
jgi:hypothetical protein